jgi:hypothetical protein
MLPADWEKLKQEEIENILLWLDEQPDKYVEFLLWQDVKKQYEEAANEWLRNQIQSEEMDTLE